jgi:hypothetical protein
MIQSIPTGLWPDLDPLLVLNHPKLVWRWFLIFQSLSQGQVINGAVALQFKEVYLASAALQFPTLLRALRGVDARREMRSRSPGRRNELEPRNPFGRPFA